MTVTINGSTGIDKVAAGAIETSDLPAGTVLQVVQGVLSTQASTTSATLVDTGLSATITPSSASNKILVLFNGIVYNAQAASGYNTAVGILRGASTYLCPSSPTSYTGSMYIATNNFNARTGTYGQVYLDSPATTNATTYKVQIASEGGSTGSLNYQSTPVTYSTLTLMEIAA